MSDVKNIITLGIGASPGGLMWFITTGLEAGAEAVVTDWITLFAPERSFDLDAAARIGLSIPSAPILLTDGAGLSTTDGSLLLFTDSTDTGIGLYAPARSFVLSSGERE